MEKVVAQRNDIGFYIKMYPLNIHPAAYDKAKAIVCEKSLKLLEDAFAGKPLPEPSCQTQAIDENIKLGKKLGITSTPTIILPDGGLAPGYKTAEQIIQIIDSMAASQGSPAAGK